MTTEAKIINKQFVLIKRISVIDPQNKSITDTIIGQYDDKQTSLAAYKEHEEAFDGKVWTLFYLVDLSEHIGKNIDDLQWFNHIIDQWPGN